MLTKKSIDTGCFYNKHKKQYFFLLAIKEVKKRIEEDNY
jgi:hypothetical protein